MKLLIALVLLAAVRANATSVVRHVVVSRDEQTVKVHDSKSAYSLSFMIKRLTVDSDLEARNKLKLACDELNGELHDGLWDEIIDFGTEVNQDCDITNDQLVCFTERRAFCDIKKG
jgi:hypothetical protein